jgi:hypothetical protein
MRVRKAAINMHAPGRVGRRWRPADGWRIVVPEMMAHRAISSTTPAGGGADEACLIAPRPGTVSRPMLWYTTCSCRRKGSAMLPRHFKPTGIHWRTVDLAGVWRPARYSADYPDIRYARPAAQQHGAGASHTTQFRIDSFSQVYEGQSHDHYGRDDRISETQEAFKEIAPFFTTHLAK